MAKKLDNFKFSEDFVGKNAGDFKAKLNDRYGKDSKKEGAKLTAKDVDSLVKKHFGKDVGAEKLDVDGDDKANKEQG